MDDETSATASPFLLTGINGTTGEYLPGPKRLNEVYEAITGKPSRDGVFDAPVYDALRERERRSGEVPYGVAAGIDAHKLEQCGWGAIFHADAPPVLFDALRPLLDLRKGQATKKHAEFYKEFAGAFGYHDGDDGPGFLRRLGRAYAQPADPRRGVPYYLLIVGSPEQIPWRFHYAMDVDYAVGRICFETAGGGPDYDAYARYARSVVLAETTPPALPKTVSFFAPSHDRATAYSSGKLVQPLRTELEEWNRETERGWSFEEHLRGDARKDRMAELVGGAKAPSVLFTAGHGLGFDRDDPRQPHHQGGLVCQDIGDVRGGGPVPEKAYFHAADLPAAARLHGMISFHFACYGAGTPAIDDYPDAERKVFLNQPIAPRPFVSRLPQAMLGHPNGGSLAYIGHVDRAWSCSFLLGTQKQQIDVFGSFLKELLEGYPVGKALEYFNARYSALATVLTGQLDLVRKKRIPDDEFRGAVVANWLEHNDARNYVIFGDPAVRVRTNAGSPADFPNVATIATHEPHSPARIESPRETEPHPAPIDPAQIATPCAISATITHGEASIMISLALTVRIEIASIEPFKATVGASIAPLGPAPSTSPST